MPKGIYERKSYMGNCHPDKTEAIIKELKRGTPWSRIALVVKVSRSKIALVAKSLKND